MSDLSFSLVLFGPPVVRRIEPDGREIELVWRLRRALQVVVFLAVQPDRRCDKDKLIDAIWPETSAEMIRRNLHPTVTDARRTLAGRGQDRREVILFRHGVYALSPEAEWHLDVERYRRLIEDGRTIRESAPDDALESWMFAWKLHRGLFVEGTDAPWLVSWREELQRDHLELLKGIGEVSAELGQVTGALDAYRSVLIEEPYEEHVHMKVMELYALQGRRDLVRKQYVRLQEHLKELGVGPLEETQNCYHRLMR